MEGNWNSKKEKELKLYHPNDTAKIYNLKLKFLYITSIDNTKLLYYHKIQRRIKCFI